jgi:hypothetical protein
MPLPHQLARSDDPPGYRVWYDGVEVGSVSQKHNHVSQQWSWIWGVDTMPLMSHGGRVPTGDVQSLEQALEKFKAAFTIWMEVLHPGDWQRNRDFKKAGCGAPPAPISWFIMSHCMKDRC